MRPRLTVPVLLVGVLLHLAACAEPGAESPGSQPSAESGAQLIDESGAVTAWLYHPAPALDGLASPDEFQAMEAAGALRVTAPEGWDVRVVWGANPCQTRPTVRVRGSAAAITAIEVDHGSRSGRDCGDSLELHAVDLRISPDAATSDIAVSGRRSG